LTTNHQAPPGATGSVTRRHRRRRGLTHPVDLCDAECHSALTGDGGNFFGFSRMNSAPPGAMGSVTPCRLGRRGVSCSANWGDGECHAAPPGVTGSVTPFVNICKLILTLCVAPVGGESHSASPQSAGSLTWRCPGQRRVSCFAAPRLHNICLILGDFRLRRLGQRRVSLSDNWAERSVTLRQLRRQGMSLGAVPRCLGMFKSSNISSISEKIFLLEVQCLMAYLERVKLKKGGVIYHAWVP